MFLRISIYNMNERGYKSCFIFLFWILMVDGLPFDTDTKIIILISIKAMHREIK